MDITDIDSKATIEFPDICLQAFSPRSRNPNVFIVYLNRSSDAYFLLILDNLIPF